MAEDAGEYGVLICVDGSASSDAAVAWGTREAIMHRLPVTLMYAVPPVVVGWPVGQLYADMPDGSRTKRARSSNGRARP